MSNIKNKDIIYAVMRKDTYPSDSSFGDRDVVCCFTKTILGAEELCGEHQQDWNDTGGGEDSYYYVVGNIFYDR